MEQLSKVINALFSSSVPLTIQWDEKCSPALTSKESVNQLAVTVSRENVTNLLGVSTVHSATDQVQAEAVYNILED